MDKKRSTPLQKELPVAFLIKAGLSNCNQSGEMIVLKLPFIKNAGTAFGGNYEYQ
jgi:hypothetical protein